jgi:histidinol-phosphate aminotransferase
MTNIRPRAGVLRIRPHMLVEEESNTKNIEINIASNESAYGASPAAISAGINAMHDIERYSEMAPDILAREIAAHFDLKADGVVCGFGSDDILARIARAYLSAGDELIYSVNGYQKIPNYAYVNDAEAVAASDRNFTVDVDAILNCVTDSSRMVMIANPDNPTASYISGKEVRRLHAELPDNVLLVLDSAYLEYVDADDYESPIRLIEEMDNVVMTRTFSKIFGLAGIRLGWSYAPKAIADILRRVGITFPVSSPALNSGLAALKDTEHTAYVYLETRRVRRWFANMLSEHNVIVHPSQTNFLLTTFPDPLRTAQMAYDYLRENGIVARRFPSPNFSDCIRFTIGLEKEMSRTADVLQTFFGSFGKN